MTNGEKLKQICPEWLCLFSKSWLDSEYIESTNKIDYRRAFKIACDLLNGDVLYGIDTDKIFELMMQKDGVVSSSSYREYILDHLQELDQGQYVSESVTPTGATTKNNLAVDKAKKDSELIARGDVINMIKEISEYHTGDSFNAERLIRNIKELPPITPELSSATRKNSKKLENASPIIDWNNCHTSEQIDSISTTKDDLAVDAVSRAKAIEATQDKAKKLTNEDTINGLCGAVAILYDLPPVTPIRPKGHWISHREHCEMNNLMPSGLGSYLWCSECDCGVDSKVFHRINYNYCPNCGADMREVEE